MGECKQHEFICDATVCEYKRYIFDGCNQKSNVLYESVLVLPRKPFFVSFPDNTPVACDEDVDLTTCPPNRFKDPIINPGCRGSLALLRYTDTIDDKEKCAQKIFRKFRVEIDGCENELYNERIQQLYVQDRQAPYFTSFPLDKHMEFFEPYGPRDTEWPRAFDSCGHGPSLITYNDSLVDPLRKSERKIERTWRVEDSCGNRREQIQTIFIKNLISNETKSKWDFSKYLTMSFCSLSLSNVDIMGETSARENVTLNYSRIGYDLNLSQKCSDANLKFMLSSSNQIQMSDSLVNGAVRTQSKFYSKNYFDYEKSHEAAIQFSLFLNTTIKRLNTGFIKMKCNEHTIQTDKGYPIQNFKNSSCIGNELRQIQMNLIDTSKETNLKIYPDKVVLKGNELIYNIFNFDDEMYISDRTLVLDIPPYSFAIINMDIIDIDHLNISNIVFVNDRVSLLNLSCK